MLELFRNGAGGFIGWLDPLCCISTDVLKIPLSHDEQVSRENGVDKDVHTQVTPTDEPKNGECDIKHDRYMPGKA